LSLFLFIVGQLHKFSDFIFTTHWSWWHKICHCSQTKKKII